jgi:hypothetical protein|nr:MAG TPA: hypothetical protein [Caudoviricetes sp.]
MDYRAQYRQLVGELERLGGDLRGVPRYYSLEAEAKVRRLIKERQGGAPPRGEEPPRGGEPPRANSGDSTQTKDKGEWPFAPTSGGEQAKREDLIADYPVALHGVYRAKREAWLRACSLKLTLNAVPMEEEDKARELQRQLWQLFSAMDNYDVVLQYWRDHKKILEPQKEDYSRLTPVELVQRRNTLRSNIVSREKSLAKWEEQARSEELRVKSEELSVKSEGGMTGRSLWVLQEKIARKREEVEQMKLQVKEIEKLLSP